MGDMNVNIASTNIQNVHSAVSDAAATKGKLGGLFGGRKAMYLTQNQDGNISLKAMTNREARAEARSMADTGGKVCRVSADHLRQILSKANPSGADSKISNMLLDKKFSKMASGGIGGGLRRMTGLATVINKAEPKAAAAPQPRREPQKAGGEAPDIPSGSQIDERFAARQGRAAAPSPNSEAAVRARLEQQAPAPKNPRSAGEVRKQLAQERLAEWKADDAKVKSQDYQHDKTVDGARQRRNEQIDVKNQILSFAKGARAASSKEEIIDLKMEIKQYSRSISGTPQHEAALGKIMQALDKKLEALRG